MTTALLILLIIAATAGCIYGINRDERRQQDRDTHDLQPRRGCAILGINHGDDYQARRRAADAPRSFR